MGAQGVTAQQRVLHDDATGKLNYDSDRTGTALAVNFAVRDCATIITLELDDV